MSNDCNWSSLVRQSCCCCELKRFSLSCHMHRCPVSCRGVVRGPGVMAPCRATSGPWVLSMRQCVIGARGLHCVSHWGWSGQGPEWQTRTTYRDHVQSHAFPMLPHTKQWGLPQLSLLLLLLLLLLFFCFFLELMCLPLYSYLLEVLTKPPFSNPLGCFFFSSFSFPHFFFCVNGR